MRTILTYVFLLCIMYFVMAVINAEAQRTDDFKYNGAPGIMESSVRSNYQFNGYTNSWMNDYRVLSRYGNLFKISMPDVEKKIVQSKIDIAEDLKIPGLWMQEGFLWNWLASSARVLDNPGLKELQSAAGTGDVLVMVDPASESGQWLMNKYPGNNGWRQLLKSYQFNDPGLITIDAFMLESDSKKIFVVASADSDSRLKTLDLMNNVREVIAKFDMHKGWFGVQTLLKSVTCGPGHPIEIIGKGMNEGNTWYVFSGYMEFMAKGELESWLARLKLPIVADVGYYPIFGLDNYDGLQVQDMPTRQSWIDYADKKNGYVFHPVYDPGSDIYDFDGYLVSEKGNKLQADSENIPFVVNTGNMLRGLLNSMILFIGKGEKLTREKIWEAIMERREVAVLGEEVVIMGPELFRTAIQMLYLDRVFLENYYGDRIDINAEMDGYNLNFTLYNTYSHSVSGKVDFQLPEGVVSDETLTSSVTIPANSGTTISLKIRPEAKGMDTSNPVVAGFIWGDNKKYTMCVMDMPPAISVHRLLYGHTPVIKYPVTVHNFTKETSYPVTVNVFDKNKPGKVLFSATQKSSNPIGTFNELIFDLKLSAGSYDVEVTALGVKIVSQLGVGKATGSAWAYELDLNADGVNEYRLENDSVQVTLLSTGARVIEYIVKSRNDNVLFKLWPNKSGYDKAPDCFTEYYPYGGFEDFLGQPSMETHKVNHAEMIKSKGDYVQVKMVADYYGNKLEKIFTLYGNSPLLEVRYALTFKNPEANVIGPQPILEIGKTHGTEDLFIVPSMEGLEELRMRPEMRFGRIIKVKEGWNAGYDTKEDISFIGAFPVTQPFFLHMWMNHPAKVYSPFYYVEFQPWVPIYQKSIMYFTYYLWGAGGPWQESLKELRKRNLITTR